MICEKLSSGLGTRCYYEDTYKTCKEGWIKMELEYQTPEETIMEINKTEKSNKNSNRESCGQTGCIEI